MTQAFKKGDHIKLPPTLSQPGGDYRIVEINAELVRLISKKGDKRIESLNDLPNLIARAAPAPRSPVSSEVFRRDKGVLSAEGYHVGRSAGLPANRRQIILRRVWEKPASDLRVDGDEIYRAEWGDARSEPRLAKIIRCLDSFIDLHLGRGPEYRQSLVDWLTDLQWLDEEIRVSNRFTCSSRWR